MNLPEEVWVAGKGPSLDHYDWSKAGDFRIGLNEASLIIPGCTAVIAMDYNVWKTVQAKIKPGVQVWMEAGIMAKEYLAWPNNPLVRWETGVHAPIACETCPACIRICGYYGVKIIHFVGCDAINYSESDHDQKGKPYAKSILPLDTSARRNHEYRPINKHIWMALKRSKITPVWEHTSETLVNPWIKETDNEEASNSAKPFVTGRL